MIPQNSQNRRFYGKAGSSENVIPLLVDDGLLYFTQLTKYQWADFD